MYSDTLVELSHSAQKKRKLLKNNLAGYIVSSMLAGFFIGLGIALIFAVGAPFYDAESPALKLVMGTSFGIALSLVIFAGSELYTSNTMTMPVGALYKTVKSSDAALVIGVSWVGNLLGALLLAGLVSVSGVLGHATHLLEKYAVTKMATGPLELFVRGVLCNILVCLAVWTSTRTKSDAAKLILIFWCLFGFIGTGYEHSIANMSLLAMTIMLGASHGIGWDGYFYNLIVVSLGNLVAGILFMALPYYLISKEKHKPAPGEMEKDGKDRAVSDGTANGSTPGFTLRGGRAESESLRENGMEPLSTRDSAERQRVLTKR